MAEYFIEMIPQGRYVKVVAIDPVSGREVILMGDPRQPVGVLKKLAVQKLEFVLNRPS